MSGFDYVGTKLRVFTHGPGIQSWEECFRNYGKQHRQDLANLEMLLKWLGDQGKLTASKISHLKPYNLYQVKNKFGFRAVGWFSTGCFVIAEVYLRKQNKVSKSDAHLLKRVSEIQIEYERRFKR